MLEHPPSKREFMRECDDWWVLNALLRPNMRKDKTGEYWPEPRANKGGRSLGHREMFMRHRAPALRKMGFSDAEIEERFQQWNKSYQGATK